MSETRNVVVWPHARMYLQREAARLYRLAVKAPLEFERGRLAGMAEQCETLVNLPETLAVLEEEDARVREQGESRQSLPREVNEA